MSPDRLKVERFRGFFFRWKWPYNTLCLQLNILISRLVAYSQYVSVMKMHTQLCFRGQALLLWLIIGILVTHQVLQCVKCVVISYKIRNVPSVCLYLRTYICLSVNPSAKVSVCLSVCFSVSLYACMYISMYVYLSCRFILTPQFN